MLMNQLTELSLSYEQLKQLYQHELPAFVCMAKQSKSVKHFKLQILEYINGNSSLDTDAKQLINCLIDYDGKQIHELSTDSFLFVDTFSILYAFLNGIQNDTLHTDFLIDLYHQLKRLYKPQLAMPAVGQVLEQINRWPSGLDKAVHQLHIHNKERVLDQLVHRISESNQLNSRYKFPDGLAYEEKYKLVTTWWNDYRFQLAMAIRNPHDLNSFLANSLSEETMNLLSAAYQKGIPFFITPYYLSLLDTSGQGYDDQALRSYILYSPQLVKAFGKITAWEKEDVIEPGKPNAAGWLLPDGHNIHRRYPEVAILIPDTTGRACGGLCASCQRMYDFQSKRFNFNLDTLKPKENWKAKLERLLGYFENDTQLRDILITGGDAFMSSNQSLKTILEAVYQMALRKRASNLKRDNGKKYAEIQRVRLGTRLPVYLPMRIDDELIDILRKFKEKATQLGVRQFIIQTHFITPLEVTTDAEEGIRKLLSAGWIIDNQLVYNVAASRRGHTAKLRQVLNKLGVLCYYTFTVKGFEENYAVFAPNARSVQEQHEEKRLGKLSEHDAHLLTQSLNVTSDIASCIGSFMKSRGLPFLATDRNVLNLPAIGKSMTFQMVGITPQGKRILCFDHDSTRRHSPIIDRLGKVFIIENKSIAAYLRQLTLMGENVNEYASIWNYTEGNTEPRFSLYEYPDYSFTLTDYITNLEIPIYTSKN